MQTQDNVLLLADCTLSHTAEVVSDCAGHVDWELWWTGNSAIVR